MRSHKESDRRGSNALLQSLDLLDAVLLEIQAAQVHERSEPLDPHNLLVAQAQVQ